MRKYHIYHATGPFLVTVEAEDDSAFTSMLDKGTILKIKPYVYLQVYTDNPDSTYPHISKRPAEPPEKEEYETQHP